MKLSKKFLFILLGFVLSSFGRRNNNPPQENCSTKMIRFYLTSETYSPIPAISFENNQHCLPNAGEWRDPSSAPGNPWYNTANYFKMCRVDVIPQGSSCGNIGRFWYYPIVQMTSGGKCYIEVPIYINKTNDVEINALSDCNLPGLPKVLNPSTSQLKTHRAYYKPTMPITIWGGTGGASSWTARMRVDPISFSYGNGMTKC